MHQGMLNQSDKFSGLEFIFTFTILKASILIPEYLFFLFHHSVRFEVV